MTKTIKLNGIVFNFKRAYPTKSMATIEAKYIRNKGYNVRTRPYGSGYANYVH